MAATWFAADGQGKNRQWTLQNVIERLKGIRKQRVKVSDIQFDQVTQADPEQQKILDLLQVKRLRRCRPPSQPFAGADAWRGW